MNDHIELLTLKEACDILRVSRPTLVRLIRSGKIKGFKVGTRVWKIARSEVLDYISRSAAWEKPTL
ncbi:MAG: helix-turn-helix domain-containing protein [Clostridia bacterium]|nr:helix-turn-helix domain-containing protein [Clostridia bacterium]